MRFKPSACMTFILGLILFSCNRNLVNLEFTNAKDDMTPGTNLVFRFDKSLITDSLIISKIYENNLLSAQKNGYYPQEKENGDTYNKNYRIDFLSNSKY